MKRPRRLLAPALMAAAAVVATVVAVRTAAPSEPAAPASEAAARTSFPGLEPATGEPQLPSLASLRPSAGTVVQASGPFDDRLQLDELSFDGTAVHGSAQVLSDVSDILEFEALAGFYDAQGRLLGTGRFVHHLDEDLAEPDGPAGPPDELEAFTIAVPREVQGQAVAAAVGVPVLVNE